MPILVAVASIAFITAIAWAIRKIAGVNICPICAGVAGTWMWMLIGQLTGQISSPEFRLTTAILMGGSVVGIAYQIEKRAFVKISAGKLLVWKAIFIPLGFVAVYSALAETWGWFLVSATAASVSVVAFTAARKTNGRREKIVEELEKKMENCC